MSHRNNKLSYFKRLIFLLNIEYKSNEMNMKQLKKQIPVEALKLLPWYATGWLSPQERGYIQKVLSQYPDFQNLLDAERKMINVVKEDKSILDKSCLDATEIRLNKVLEQISSTNEENKKTSIGVNQGVLAHLSNLVLSCSPKIQYAVIVAVTTVTIALSFAFVAPLLDENNVYYPATSGVKKSNNNLTTLLVGLNIEPTDPRLLKILDENNAKIDAIPSKSGMHHLTLSVKLNATQIKSLLKTLRDNKALFWFAGEEF